MELRIIAVILCLLTLLVMQVGESGFGNTRSFGQAFEQQAWGGISNHETGRGLFSPLDLPMPGAKFVRASH